MDTPGQKDLKHERSKAYVDFLKEEFAGIINVVCFGYHEYRIGKEKVLKENKTVYSSFLKNHHKVEIEALKEWIPLIGSPETAKWFVTLVTKADIWWDQKDKIIKYYKSGLYYKHLDKLKSIHRVIEYCSERRRFFGEGIQSMTFDDFEKIKMRANILRFLCESIK